MTPEQQAAYVQAQAAAAIIEMNGMIAENQKRESEGRAHAYGEKEFLALIDRCGLGHNAVLKTFGV